MVFEAIVGKAMLALVHGHTRRTLESQERDKADRVCFGEEMNGTAYVLQAMARGKRKRNTEHKGLEAQAE